MLKEGSKLPDFRLPNQDGEERSAASYKGQWLVLYVYPKDDTPGCTLQGNSFTAKRDEFSRRQTKVVGLSQDDVASHKNFCQKFSFQVELLADPEARLLQALGVGQSEWKGTLYWDRTTFLVDPEGTVRKVYEKVNPEGHEELLLRELDSLRA